MGGEGNTKKSYGWRQRKKSETNFLPLRIAPLLEKTNESEVTVRLTFLQDKYSDSLQAWGKWGKKRQTLNVRMMWSNRHLLCAYFVSGSVYLGAFTYILI